MIEIKHICKDYGDKRVVDDVSLQVEKGQTLVLLGTSGSGKTTLLKMINHLIFPSQGSISVGGENVAEIDLSTLRRKIGYVIQQVGLFPHYSILENIGLVLKLEGWSEKDRRVRSEEMLQSVGLDTEYGKRYPHELSGGQQQRVGIARAMANDPPIILMDEPFGALDPITKQNLIDELRSKQMFVDKTVVIVTHDVFEAVTLGDQICLLDAGQIKQLGSPKELLFHPKSDFVKAFFDAQRFRLELGVTELEEIVPFMESGREPASEATPVGAEQSIWDTLETAERNSNNLISITRNGRSVSTGTPEDLLKAFYQYKKEMLTPPDAQYL